LSELTDVTASRPVIVHHGHKIVEIASQLVSKGAVVRRLIADYRPAMALAAGDDQTDETMFDLQPELDIELHTVCVGDGPSRARWRSTIPKLRKFLEALTTQLHG